MIEGNSESLFAPGIHGECVMMRDLSREEVDFCIVGAGAGGGVLGAKLAEAGFSVVILDAGPHWDPTKDFVSDEIASRKLFWTDERITGGQDPIELGANNPGRGVGGSTVHYSMVAMRAHPDDFLRHTLHGEIAGANICDYSWGGPYNSILIWRSSRYRRDCFGGPSDVSRGPSHKNSPSCVRHATESCGKGDELKMI